MEPLDADLAAPGPLRRLLDGRDEAVHVVAAVAVVAEEQLWMEESWFILLVTRSDWKYDQFDPHTCEGRYFYHGRNERGRT